MNARGLRKAWAIRIIRAEALMSPTLPLILRRNHGELRKIGGKPDKV